MEVLHLSNISSSVENRIYPHENCTSNNGAMDFLSRLQLADEIEILSENPLLWKYDHIWRNPHWFDCVQSLYPVGLGSQTKKEEEKDATDRNIAGSVPSWNPKESPSIVQLDGVKLMQESLMCYTFEGDRLGGGSSQLSFSQNLSTECQRLLDGSQSTKQRGHSSRLLGDLPVLDAVEDVCLRLHALTLEPQAGSSMQPNLQVRSQSEWVGIRDPS